MHPSYAGPSSYRYWACRFLHAPLPVLARVQPPAPRPAPDSASRQRLSLSPISLLWEYEIGLAVSASATRPYVTNSPTGLGASCTTQVQVLPWHHQLPCAKLPGRQPTAKAKGNCVLPRRWLAAHGLQRGESRQVSIGSARQVCWCGRVPQMCLRVPVEGFIVPALPDILHSGQLPEPGESTQFAHWRAQRAAGKHSVTKWHGWAL